MKNLSLICYILTLLFIIFNIVSKIHASTFGMPIGKNSFTNISCKFVFFQLSHYKSLQMKKNIKISIILDYE
jgi:hypothetical protein